MGHDPFAIKLFVYSLLFALANGVCYAALFSFDIYMISKRPQTHKRLTDRGVLILILMVISLFLAAFFYFRATFPH